MSAETLLGILLGFITVILIVSRNIYRAIINKSIAKRFVYENFCAILRDDFLGKSITPDYIFERIYQGYYFPEKPTYGSLSEYHNENAREYIIAAYAYSYYTELYWSLNPLEDKWKHIWAIENYNPVTYHDIRKLYRGNV